MAPHLRPCPRCSRHVRVSEGACPFCGVSLDPSFGATPVPLGSAMRLSRAALFALGTGAAIVTPVFAIDCSATPSYGGSPVQSIPPYGQVPVPEDGGEGPQDSARAAPDVDVGSVDAGDGSVDDTGSDGGTDGTASDAQSDAVTGD